MVKEGENKGRQVKDEPTEKRYYIYTKELYGRLSLPVARKLAKTRITPNQVSLFSLACGLISALMFALGYQIYLIIGIILLQFSVFLDYLDGSLAREKKLVSVYGCWIDCVGDRVVDFFVFFALAFGVFSITGNYLIWILCSLVLGGHYLVIYTHLSVGWLVYEMKVVEEIKTSRFKKIFSLSRATIYLLLVVFVLLNNISWYFYLIVIYSWLSYFGAVGFFTIKFKRYTGPAKISMK